MNLLKHRFHFYLIQYFFLFKLKLKLKLTSLNMKYYLDFILMRLYYFII